MIVTVGCHKGGVGKTTTAVMTALQLQRHGPTVLIDGDRQGSATTWARMSGDAWPANLTVVPWSDPLTLPPEWSGDGSGHVVVDTGPGDPVRLRAALMLADVAVIPIGSRRGDVAQLGETVQTIEDAANARRRPLPWGALLTFVRLSTRAARQAPAVIERDFPLLQTVIPLSEAIAESFGTVPSRFYAYADLFREITEVPADA